MLVSSSTQHASSSRSHSTRLQKPIQDKFGFKTPLPTPLSSFTKRPTRHAEAIDENIASKWIEKAVEVRMKAKITAHIKRLAQQSRSAILSLPDFMEKLEDLQSDLLEKSRVPRGLFDLANELGGLSSFTIQKHLGHNHQVLELWKTYVINHFDEITRNNYDQYEEFHRAALNNRPGFPEEERTRTFRVMLSAILRPDLPEATKQIFVNRIEKAAIIMTDLKADMYSLIHMVMLECASRGFAVQANTEKVSLNSPQFSSHLDIAELLPVTWHRHKETLVDGKFIPVAPIPNNLTKISKKSDISGLFNSGHIQWLYTNHFSSATKSNATSGETHPIWSELKVLGLETSPTSGLSSTAISSVHQVAESVMRMWSGNIFRRSLDRLLLVCLRKHLAPKKERAELDRKKEKTEQVKENQNVKHRNRHVLWQAIRKEKKLIEKYERKKTWKWDMSYDEVDKYHLLIQGCHRRIQILRRKLDNIPKKLTNQHDLSDDGEANSMKVDDNIDAVTVEDEYNMDNEVHTGEYEFDAEGYEYDTEDYDYDSEDYDHNTEDVHATEQDDNRDSSASKIRAFKAIIKKILLEKDCGKLIQTQQLFTQIISLHLIS
jgi:hypothetical protein